MGEHAAETLIVKTLLVETRDDSWDEAEVELAAR